MHQMLTCARLILGAVVTVALAGPGAAQDATVELGGFGDFSGAETQLPFDDLGMVNGDDVADVDGVVFGLSAGGPGKYFEDAFPRMTGPEGAGSVNNFWGFASPYPDLEISFPAVVHRVGFEARVNDADDVAVTLFSDGVEVEVMVVPSRGSDAFYFYGYENAGGFDAVQVDVVANASGAFSLDNLTFESLASEEPPEEQTPELARYACEGFESFPPANDRRRRFVPFRVLVAQLTDAEGEVVTADALPEAPAVRVMFTPDGADESMDVTEKVVWAGATRFAPSRGGHWLTWLRSWHMREPGLYMATLESGDGSAYTVDPVCADWTWNPPRKLRRHLRWWLHRLHR